MRRREFIALFGSGAAAWPLAARAQTSGKTYRIGFLGVFSYAEYKRLVNALLMGLRQLGYDEGRTLSSTIGGLRAGTTASPSSQPSW
jgi:putative tryptophan/tyrosine transport system substrate-binding protein